MKYIVSIDHIDFEFSDGVTAIGFAEIARNGFKPDNYVSEITVTIRLEASDVNRDSDRA